MKVTLVSPPCSSFLSEDMAILSQNQVDGSMLIEELKMLRSTLIAYQK